MKPYFAIGTAILLLFAAVNLWQASNGLNLPNSAWVGGLCAAMCGMFWSRTLLG